MFCRSIKNSSFWIVLIAVGLISILFGSITNGMIPDDAHNLSMFTGMFAGVGGAFIAIGILKLVRLKTRSPERLKQEEIELKDERDIQILRNSQSVANTTSTIIFGFMAFGFVYFDYIVPAFVAIAAIYIQIAVFFLANKYYREKM